MKQAQTCIAFIAIITLFTVVLAGCAALPASTPAPTATTSSVSSTAASTIMGPWNDAADQRVLIFQNDGTVILRNANGDVPATYVFDNSTGTGMISYNSVTMPMRLSGDTLIVTDKIDTPFVRGDLAITPASLPPTTAPSPATPTSVSTVTPAPMVSPSGTSTSTHTATPTNTATHTPTPTPTATTTGTHTSTPTPTATTSPTATPTFTPTPVPTSPVGTWVATWDSNLKLILNADFTFVTRDKTLDTGSGTYTFDKSTLRGVLTYSGGKEQTNFVIYPSGTFLNTDTSLYRR